MVGVPLSFLHQVTKGVGGCNIAVTKVLLEDKSALELGRINDEPVFAVGKSRMRFSIDLEADQAH